MKLVHKRGMLRSSMRFRRPYRIILHHTAGGSLGGAESTLQNRGLAYHYMIDKDGTIYEYVPPDRFAAHAYGHNRGTIGIAFVGGGKFGPATAEQLDACASLMKLIKMDYPAVTEFTGHKHADPRGWKIDPRFHGEPENGIDWELDYKAMKKLEERSGLKAVFLRGKHAER